MSAACHRSLYGYQLRTALALAVENTAHRRHLPAARLHRGDDRDAACSARRAPAMPADRALRRHACRRRSSSCRTCSTRPASRSPSRKLDLVLLTVGANDIKFSGLVADVIISAGVERTLFNQGGLLATVPQAQALLDREFPDGFRQAAQRAEAAGRRQPVPRRLRVLRPSGDGRRRALPRRPRRPRHASGVHRRRRRG